MCSLNVFIELVFNIDLNPWKHPLLFLTLVTFTKQIYLLTVQYLFLFRFPGYFPQTTFLLFSVLAVASAVLVGALLQCKAAVLMSWGLCHIGDVFWSFCVLLYPFASGPCCLTSVPGLNSLLFSLWKISHVCKGGLSCPEKQMRERMFLRGCCLRDASKALKKALSLLCFHLSPQIPEFHVSQNTFLSKERCEDNAVRWFCVAFSWTGQSISVAEWFGAKLHCWWLVLVHELE